MFLIKYFKGCCAQDIIFDIREIKIWDKSRTDILSYKYNYNY